MKLYWKLENFVMALVLRFVGGTGLLRTKPDARDHEADLGFGQYTPKYEQISYFQYQFQQNPFNICVFAGGVLAVSEQLGVRFSVKFAVKLAKKLGMISGNGFSYQRAILDILVKHGMVTYEDMPDEVNESWYEYSKWDEKAQYLLDTVAPKYKFTEYQKLRNESAILEAQDKGYVVVTASDWYQAMNNPRAPGFLLKMIGSKLGGHQYRSTGYRKKGFDFETPQTFSERYGDKGKAWSETLFGRGYFDNWILNYNGSPLLPTDKLLPLFTKQQEGNMVKSPERYGDPKCYVIQDGKKHHVRGDDEMKTYHSLYSKVGLTYVKKELLDLVPEANPYPYEV